MSFVKLLCVLTVLIFSVGSEKILIQEGVIKTSNSASKVTIKSLGDVSLKSFPENVTYIYFLRGSIPELFPGSFNGLPNLSVISAQKKNISTISPGCFLNLPTLNTINLASNKIKEIGDGIFNHLNIKKLYLHRNKITVIHSNAFDNLPHLELIKLNSNELATYDGGWFKSLPSLKTIYFKRNYLKSLPKQAFSNIKGENLTLYFSKNTIAYVNNEAFEGLTEIKKLFFARNNFANFNFTVFRNIKHIGILDLQKNFITKLNSDDSHGLKIGKINLKKNPLSCLPENMKNICSNITVSNKFLLRKKCN